MILVRICGALVALLVCAWFALGIRQAQDTNAANAIIAKPPHIAVTQSSRAGQLLRFADTLNPDLTVKILQARFAMLQRQHQRALGILRDVVMQEPMNAAAWAYLTEAAFPSDPGTLRLGVKKIRELDPKTR